MTAAIRASCTEAEDDPDERADTMTWWFVQASCGSDALAWRLSNALEFLAAAVTRGTISITMRDRLLNSIRDAKDHALEMLPHRCDPDRISQGMDAAAGLAIRWAEPEKQRCRRHADTYLDLRSHTRLLRNDLDSLAVCEELNRRAAERAADRVSRALEIDPFR